MAKRTATSYTVLGLLALRSMSAYELVQGYARSIGQVSSRSDAVLYNEPKRLMSDGLVSAAEEQRGKRKVAVYSITEAGLDALLGWLEEPAAFPVLEADPVVRVVFGDPTDHDTIKRTIVDFRDETQARLDFLATMAAAYADGGGLYPERVHVVALSGRFVGFLFQAYVDWCDWALDSMDSWPDDLDGKQEWGRQTLEDYLTSTRWRPGQA